MSLVFRSSLCGRYSKAVLMAICRITCPGKAVSSFFTHIEAVMIPPAACFGYRGGDYPRPPHAASRTWNHRTRASRCTRRRSAQVAIAICDFLRSRSSAKLAAQAITPPRTTPSKPISPPVHSSEPPARRPTIAPATNPPSNASQAGTGRTRSDHAVLARPCNCRNVSTSSATRLPSLRTRRAETDLVTQTSSIMGLCKVRNHWPLTGLLQRLDVQRVGPALTPVAPGGESGGSNSSSSP